MSRSCLLSMLTKDCPPPMPCLVQIRQCLKELKLRCGGGGHTHGYRQKKTWNTHGCRHIHTHTWLQVHTNTHTHSLSLIQLVRLSALTHLPVPHPLTCLFLTHLPAPPPPSPLQQRRGVGSGAQEGGQRGKGGGHSAVSQGTLGEWGVATEWEGGGGTGAIEV